MAEFKNPNQQGNPQDSRSLMIVMLAMVLGLTGFQYYRTTHNPQTASPNQPPQGQQSQQKPTPEPTVAATVAGQTIQVPVLQGAAETTTTVENELYRITFSNRGAQATSWILKN